MFSDKSKKTDKNAVRYDTLISTKTTVVGDITVTGGLHIDGVVRGNLIADLESNATIRISESGQVAGQISAPNIIINGSVQGDVFASSYLELAGKARIKGDVYYERMEMVLGAQINGQIHHRDAANNASVKSASSVDKSSTDKTDTKTQHGKTVAGSVSQEAIPTATGQ